MVAIKNNTLSKKYLQKNELLLVMFSYLAVVVDWEHILNISHRSLQRLENNFYVANDAKVC